MVRKNGSQLPCAGFNFYRNALILLNVLYIVVAFVLISLAAFGNYSAYIVDFSLFGGIIACGAFLLMIAVVGLVATMLHHQVTLFFYMIVLVLLFLMQLSVACACLALTPAQQQQLFNLAWNDSTDEVKMRMQRDFNCCGGYMPATHAGMPVLNASNIDSNSTTPICRVQSTLPPCCINSSSFICTGQREASENSSTTSSCLSCWATVAPDIRYALKAAGGVGLFFSFTEIVGVWLAFRYRNQKNPYANPNDFL